MADDDLARGQHIIKLATNRGYAMKTAFEAITLKLGKQQAAGKKTDKLQLADTETDKGEKIPPPDVTECARYIVEQTKLIKQGRRPRVTKKQLISEHLSGGDTGAMEKALQPRMLATS